jgi:membrane protein
VLSALAGVVLVPVALNYLYLSNFADLLVRIARWPALLVAIALAISIIYRFGPSREAPRWRWITCGSAVATVLWLVPSALFSWYAPLWHV